MPSTIQADAASCWSTWPDRVPAETISVSTGAISLRMPCWCWTYHLWTEMTVESHILVHLSLVSYAGKLNGTPVRRCYSSRRWCTHPSVSKPMWNPAGSSVINLNCLPVAWNEDSRCVDPISTWPSDKKSKWMHGQKYTRHHKHSCHPPTPNPQSPPRKAKDVSAML